MTHEWIKWTKKTKVWKKNGKTKRTIAVDNNILTVMIQLIHNININTKSNVNDCRMQITQCTCHVNDIHPKYISLMQLFIVYIVYTIALYFYDAHMKW